ncbi:hypothetical protein CRE_23750 [Caenorhabditis remanei]|uniref:SPK domain-containing protein n=1 Tax=Caenorhabditis remanei TaxID=31234 RepID=E3NHS9_CAERE|nr:hypothetical protein CRE_23750 [Caenorhabditis remanei]
MSNPKKKKTGGPSMDDEEAIWEFIYENICVMDLYEGVTEALFEQYLKENGKKWTVRELSDYFNTSMKQSLYKCDLPAETMLSLFKKLEIEMSTHVEELLEKRFGAVLRIDEDRCLRKFKMIAQSNSTEIVEKSVEKPTEKPKNPEIPPQKPSEPEPKRRKLEATIPLDLEISASLEQQIWDYISEKSTNLTGEMVLSDEFWRESLENFVDLPIKSAQLIQHHFENKMVEKMYMQQGIDAENKIRLLKELHIPISMAQNQWILENDQICLKLTSDGYIESWQRKEAEPIRVTPPPPQQSRSKITTWEPNVRLVKVSPNAPSDQPGPSGIAPSNHPDAYRNYRQPSRSPSPLADRKYRFQEKKHVKREAFTLDDQIFAWKYIFKEIHEAEKYQMPRVLPKGIRFWNEFVKRTKSAKTATNWSSHFRKQMCPTLQEMPLNRKTILYLFQNIDIELDERVHRILERKCDAKVRLVDDMVASYKLNGQENEVDVKAEIESDSDEETEDVQIEDVEEEEEEAEPLNHEIQGPGDQNPYAQVPGGWDIEENPETLDTTMPLEDGSDADEAIIEEMQEERAAAAQNLEQEPEIQILEPIFQNATPPRNWRESLRNASSKSAPTTPKTSKTARILRSNQQGISSKSAEIPRVSTRITRSYAKMTMKETPESRDIFASSSSQMTPKKAPRNAPAPEGSDEVVEETVPQPSKSSKIHNLKAMILGNPSADLVIIQETIDELGGEAFDLVNDAIEWAFKLEHWDENDEADDREYRELVESVKARTANSGIQKIILTDLPEIWEKTVGIAPNRRVFERRVGIVKKKIDEILEREEAAKWNPEVPENPEDPEEPTTSSK